MKPGDVVLVRMTVVRQATDKRPNMPRGWVLRSSRTAECYVEEHEIASVEEQKEGP